MEKKEIKALPRLLITIGSLALATIIASTFMAITGSFINAGLVIFISYITFRWLFEKLVK